MADIDYTPTLYTGVSEEHAEFRSEYAEAMAFYVAHGLSVDEADYTARHWARAMFDIEGDDKPPF